MREVRISVTAVKQLEELLKFGQDKFGFEVAKSKRDLIYNSLEALKLFPEIFRLDKKTGLHRCFRVTKTPFVIYYDFNAKTLNVHIIIHRKTNANNINIKLVEWK
jgi:plasmid stabilization system protein ParE